MNNYLNGDKAKIIFTISSFFVAVFLWKIIVVIAMILSAVYLAGTNITK